MARTADRPVAAGPHLAARGADLRHRARRAVGSSELALLVNPLAAALVARGLPRLRGRLHDAAQAPTPGRTSSGAAPPARSRRSSAGRPSTGSLDRAGGLPVRDRLLLDAAALLGAEPADEGRVREGRRADAAGRARRGRDAPPDPALHACCSTRSRSCRSAPAASARFYLVASLALGIAVHRARGRAAPPRGPRAPRCASTCSRWPTSRCCSPRWWPTSTL